MPTVAGVLALLSKRSTWITILVALGVIIAGFGIMSYGATKSENMAMKTELTLKQREIDQYAANAKASAKAIQTRNELVEALAKVETVERVKTIKALEANPDWAKQPIPADVLASLRD